MEPIFEALEGAGATDPADNVADDVIQRGREPARTYDDRALDLALRPRAFDEFVGQRRVVDNLRLYVEATRRRNAREAPASSPSTTSCSRACPASARPPSPT